MKPVRIIVCCGGGIFTTTVVSEKIGEFLDAEGIPHSLDRGKVAEIPTMSGYDIIVATGNTQQKNNNGIPVLVGMPMFTGVGVEDFQAELLETINNLER